MLKRYCSIFTDRVILASLLLGFSSGLPFTLTQSVLESWYAKASAISITTIAFVKLTSIPHTFKFCWAPLMDRFVPPFMGRRRGWILICQLLLALAIAAMAFFPPAIHPTLLMAIACTVAFLSASQDIAVDAYRVDVLPSSKRALGAAMAVNGYRIAMLVSGGLALIIADRWGFQAAYLLMAALISIGVFATFIGPEPELKVEAPRDLSSSLILPLKDFLSRPQAIWVLWFIVFYKLGDAFAGSLTQTFLIRKIHMSLTEIGTLIKLSGFLGTILGTIMGALWVPKLGWYRALFLFGVVQALANLIFIPLIWIGPNYLLAGTAIFIDNLSGGMGTAAFVGLLMGLCNHRFSAFQYALLSALAMVGRVFISPIAGLIAEAHGWEIYFLSSLAFSVPGLILLTWLKPRISRMNEEMAEQRASLSQSNEEMVEQRASLSQSVEGDQKIESAEYIIDKYCSCEENHVLGRRWIAMWIDSIVLGLCLILPDHFLGNDLYRKTIYIWVTMLILYFPLIEGLTGFTVGKFILGIKVIDYKGNVPGLGKAVGRTITRIFEVNPLFLGGLPAGLICFFSKKGQRLGDMLAGTFVISNKDLEKIKSGNPMIFNKATQFR